MFEHVEINQVITIVVAVLNGAKTLERCIQSVIGQTYPHKELIIMDGGSADGTVEILKRHDANIKYWESRPDRGIYHAWNKALDRAEGEWICFIGADDFFVDEGVLERIVPLLMDAVSHGCLYAYGQVELYSEKNQRVVEKVNEPWDIMQKRIRRGGFLAHSGSFHHRSLFDHYKFNESYKICGDKDFLYRYFTNGNAYYLNAPIIRMSMSGFSYTLEAKKKMVKEALLIWKDIPMTSFPWLLYSSLFKVGCYSLLRGVFGERFSVRFADSLRRLRGENPYWDQ